MRRIKKGIPEDKELVLCTVTKIYPHSVFVEMDEYKKTGMIHISEISPGRIRNINNYVKVGKIIVCKVLRIDQEKGHIDLSLRRVTEHQRRFKINALKQEQKAEKIIDFVSEKLKIEKNKFYDEVADKILEEYETIYDCFEDFIADETVLDGFKFDKNVLDILQETIRQRIKPPRVEIHGELSLKTYAPNGAEQIKEALLKAEKVSEAAVVRYKGAGKYTVTVVSEEYKTAEKIMKDVTDTAIEAIKKHEGEGSFLKIEA